MTIPQQEATGGFISISHLEITHIFILRIYNSNPKSYNNIGFVRELKLLNESERNMRKSYRGTDRVKKQKFIFGGVYYFYNCPRLSLFFCL